MSTAIFTPRKSVILGFSIFPSPLYSKLLHSFHCLPDAVSSSLPRTMEPFLTMHHCSPRPGPLPLWLNAASSLAFRCKLTSPWGKCTSSAMNSLVSHASFLQTEWIHPPLLLDLLYGFLGKTATSSGFNYRGCSPTVSYSEEERLRTFLTQPLSAVHRDQQVFPQLIIVSQSWTLSCPFSSMHSSKVPGQYFETFRCSTGTQSNEEGPKLDPQHHKKQTLKKCFCNHN